jgi:hypothetical protein
MEEPGQGHDRGQLIDGDRAGGRDAAEVVALEIDDHQVLGGVLGVSREVSGGGAIGARLAAARSGALDRRGLDPRSPSPQEALGGARHHRDASGLDHRAVGGRGHGGEGGVEREGIAGAPDPGGPAPGQVDLIDVAGREVARDRRHGRGVLVARAIGDQGPEVGGRPGRARPRSQGVGQGGAGAGIVADHDRRLGVAGPPGQRAVGGQPGVGHRRPGRPRPEALDGPAQVVAEVADHPRRPRPVGVERPAVFGQEPIDRRQRVAAIDRDHVTARVLEAIGPHGQGRDRRGGDHRATLAAAGRRRIDEHAVSPTGQGGGGGLRR